jgi:hypothetical protein
MGTSPYCQRGCIEHDFAKGLEIRTITGTEAKWERMGVRERNSAAAEKNDEGMALKILTIAEDMPVGKQSYLDFEYPLESKPKDNR